MFALVDCNNFYASCERVFNPALAGRPVLVLSNNDGCVVARSAESRALGIKMGEPLFKLKELVQSHGIAVYSSNYTLYGDMSARVMQILSEFTPHLEVYSIDEAFLDLQGSAAALYAQGHDIRRTVRKWLGLPVCVGIGPTKTLAKAANWGAKKCIPPAEEGVLVLDTPERQTDLLARMPLEEVWGVGPRLLRRLNALGLKTALDLREADPRWIQQQFGVVLARTVLELRGQACLELEEAPAPRQQIVVSRSFGERLTELADLHGAIASFATRAMKKLREQQSLVKTISVFIETNRFNASEPQYGQQAVVSLANPTQDSRAVIQAARQLLQRIYRRGYRYKRAGIMLLEIIPEGGQQGALFADEAGANRATELMSIVDTITKRFGRGALQFGGAVSAQRWQPVSRNCSPRYTTSWDELVEVR